MKIGKFCKKFNVSLTTVRYYILAGLLAPNKNNCQFVFTDSDMYEMEMILKLKDLNFTTEEIKQFLQVIRIYHADDNTINAQLRSIYLNKKTHLEVEIKKYLKSIHTLNEKVKECDNSYKAAECFSGIPVAFCAYLACPKCNNSLNLSDTQIKNNLIYEGRMFCNCGYSATIEDGIILAESSLIRVGDTTKNASEYYTSEEFCNLHYREPRLIEDFVLFENIHNISSEVTALIYKTYTWINSMLTQNEPKHNIIFMPDLSSHFLYKNIDNPLFKTAFIIVSGFSKQAITSIRSHIEQLAPDLQVVYIANTIYELPIKRKSIDLWIDANSSYNFSFFHDFPLQEMVKEYMNDSAHIVGYTKYYKSGAQSAKNIRRQYPYALQNNSLLSTFYANMENTNWKLLTQEDLGYASNPGEYYNYHVKEEKHHFFGFYATKKARLGND